MQALKCWPETIEREDHVEKEVLHKLIDPSKVHMYSLIHLLMYTTLHLVTSKSLTTGEKCCTLWSVTTCRCYRAKGHVNLVQCRKTCQKKIQPTLPQ